MPRSKVPPTKDAAGGVLASASDIVFLGITNGLAHQKLVPGQRLVEGDLAVQFGVGRNSVREALHRLEAEGVVDLIHHKGAVIRSLSEQETMDVLDVAERMMGLLARSAACGISNGQPPREIESALEQLISADEKNDSTAFSKARRAFYRALLDSGGSRELRRLFPSIHMPIVYAQHRLTSLQKLRLRDYQTIGKAILEGDEASADTAGVTHVRNVREEIMRAVDEADGVAVTGPTQRCGNNSAKREFGKVGS
jgi:DNA-binding GntR family transcriptional regulator